MAGHFLRRDFFVALPREVDQHAQEPVGLARLVAQHQPPAVQPQRGPVLVAAPHQLVERKRMVGNAPFDVVHRGGQVVGPHGGQPVGPGGRVETSLVFVPNRPPKLGIGPLIGRVIQVPVPEPVQRRFLDEVQDAVVCLLPGVEFLAQRRHFFGGAGRRRVINH
ncbi:hypothetical protein BEN49_14410 [Hymenobacter coccineus]|uniref:Uncharacterized protein n=1 Tax=Hymenobacter coccineus TaxID=1908235 RepID=A0A1G1SU59_9BACT|nr:hypothetical protein BEN49_14410 [Hymenobacter coccineus]